MTNMFLRETRFETPLASVISGTEPYTKYAISEIVENERYSPQFIFTVTAKEIAALRRKIPQEQPNLVAGPSGTLDSMTIIEPNESRSECSDFKAAKDLTAVFATLLVLAEKEKWSVRVWSWNGPPDPYEEARTNDDLMEQARYSPPGNEFRIWPDMSDSKYITDAARQFYKHILSETDIDPEEPSSRYTLRIFTRPAMTVGFAYGE